MSFKRVIAVLLSLILLMSFVACNGEEGDDGPSKTESQSDTDASDYDDKANPVSDFEYIVNDSGSYIKKYIGNDPDVVIPETIEGKPVKYILSQAFENNDIVVSVVMPDTITEIRYQAFQNCRSLNTVVMSKNITLMEGCVFNDCVSLSSITLPSALKKIGGNAFANCKSLTHINIPKSLTSWGDEVFANSGIKKIDFEEGVEQVGDLAFFGTNIEELVFPKSMRTIGWYSFGDCEELKSITLNEGLTRISAAAFAEASKLEEIVIPATVEYVNDVSFVNCSLLKAVKFEGNAPKDFKRSENEKSYAPFTVYYHEDAEGFTSPEWCGYPTENW